MWWSFQTPISNVSNNSAQGTLSHNQEFKEKQTQRNLIDIAVTMVTFWTIFRITYARVSIIIIVMQR